MESFLKEYRQQLLNIDNNISYKREIFEILKNDFKHINLCLVGLRQVGKTTLMLQLAKWYFDEHIKSNDSSIKIDNTLTDEEKIFYINLKSINNLNDKRKELLLEITSKKYKLIVLDEIQELDEWSNFLQTAIDLNNSARFIVSGSNAYALSKEIMVGRMKTYFIKPLLYSEYKEIWNDDDLETYLKYGSYPKSPLYQSSSVQYIELVKASIIDKIIMDDYKNKIDHSKFNVFMEDVNNYIGNEIVISRLENKNITRQTAKEYLIMMRNAQLVHFLPKYKDKNSNRKEKIYYEDKGMISYFNEYKTLNNNLLGSLIENIVFNKLDYLYNKELGPNQIFYYRDTNEKEIDFVIQSKKILIECKYSLDINPDELINHINQLIDEYKEFKDYKVIIITRDLNYKNGVFEFIKLEDFLLLSQTELESRKI